MEKLIQALAALFDKCAPEEVRESAAKGFIQSIGKAYADGELELPGEVGRWEHDEAKHLGMSLIEWFSSMLETGHETFIALRKEEE